MTRWTLGLDTLDRDIGRIGGGLVESDHRYWPVFLRSASEVIGIMDNNESGKPGPKSLTQRYGRNLALAAREAIPANIMMDYIAAIMEGHGQATLKRDGRVEGGWVVAWPANGELESTSEQKQWAWQQWRLAGFGQPAQQIHLEADLRGQITSIGATLPIGALSPGKLHAVRALLRPVLNVPAAIDSPSDQTQVPVPMLASSSSTLDTASQPAGSTDPDLGRDQG